MRAKMMLIAALVGTALALAIRSYSQSSADPLIEGFRQTEVASVADAIEQLTGRQSYMSHEMRALFKTKFVGPAVTVLMKREEHKEGAAASQGMIDAIDNSPAGSVYVMVLENGLDYGDGFPHMDVRFGIAAMLNPMAGEAWGNGEILTLLG